MKEGDAKKIIKNAINQGLAYVQQAHGIDMDIDTLRKYMDVESVIEKAGEIVTSEDIQKASNQPAFLREKIIDYIKHGEPFNEQGKRILQGGLESIAHKGFFTSEKKLQKKVGDYLNSTRSAADEANYILTHQDLYSGTEKGQELMQAAKNVYDEKGKGALREIKYAHGRMDAKTFSKQKKVDYGNIKEFLKVSDKYVAGVIGLFGFGLILVSGLSLTGNVVGNISEVGGGVIGLIFLIMGMSLFLLKKKD